MKLRRILSICLLTASITAMAQKKTEILIWDENPLETTEAKSAAIKAKDYTKDPAITVYTPKIPPERLS